MAPGAKDDNQVSVPIGLRHAHARNRVRSPHGAEFSQEEYGASHCQDWGRIAGWLMLLALDRTAEPATATATLPRMGSETSAMQSGDANSAVTNTQRSHELFSSTTLRGACA